AGRSARSFNRQADASARWIGIAAGSSGEVGMGTDAREQDPRADRQAIVRTLDALFPHHPVVELRCPATWTRPALTRPASLGVILGFNLALGTTQRRRTAHEERPRNHW